MKDLVKRLTEAYGPSGSEDKVREIIRAEVEKFADEIRVDSLGNLICRAAPKAPVAGSAPKRIMVAAHMDEIGVIVSYIDDKGFLRFSTIGGLSPYLLLGQKVVFENGTIGVFGTEKLEDMKSLAFDKMFIDIGASTREEAATDTQLKASIYSYSMSKGAFIGLSLEGAKVTPDESSNELYWKTAASPSELLRREARDSRIRPLISELNALVLRAGRKVI
jgi:hypothetical protein